MTTDPHYVLTDPHYVMTDPHYVMTRDIVDKHFPGVCVRAGVLLIYDNKILLVEEKSGNYGPPKGRVNWEIDHSVQEAAFREVRKEIGLNIANKSAQLCTNVYMYHREHHKELLVYYAVFIKYNPRIYLRKNEIVSMVWADMRTPLCSRFKCSEASSTLFRAIDSSMLFRAADSSTLVRYEHLNRTSYRRDKNGFGACTYSRLNVAKSKCGDTFNTYRQKNACGDTFNTHRQKSKCGDTFNTHRQKSKCGEKSKCVEKSK